MTEPPMTEQEIRRELGEMLDRLQKLPADAFAERAALHERQAEFEPGGGAVRGTPEH